MKVMSVLRGMSGLSIFTKEDGFLLLPGGGYVSDFLDDLLERHPNKVSARRHEKRRIYKPPHTK